MCFSMFFFAFENESPEAMLGKPTLLTRRVSNSMAALDLGLVECRGLLLVFWRAEL